MAVLGLHCCVGFFSSCSKWASHCRGFSCCGEQALGPRASVVVAYRLSCSEAHGIFPYQRSFWGSKQRPNDRKKRGPKSGGARWSPARLFPGARPEPGSRCLPPTSPGASYPSLWGSVSVKGPQCPPQSPWNPSRRSERQQVRG